MVTGGKDGTIYVLDRDRMGGFNGSYTNPIAKSSKKSGTLWVALPRPNGDPLVYVENNYITPGFWQNTCIGAQRMMCARCLI